MSLYISYEHDKEDADIFLMYPDVFHFFGTTGHAEMDSRFIWQVIPNWLLQSTDETLSTVQELGSSSNTNFYT